MIQETWSKNFHYLLPSFVLLFSMFILSLTFFLMFVFGVWYPLFVIPVFYLICSLAAGQLIFYVDIITARECGYYLMQRYLWEHWNKHPVSKRFKIFKLPGYDCRIGQLKKYRNRVR